RFAWNMRHPDAARVEDDPTWESAEATLAGPVSPPGQYRVRLEVGGERHEAAFEIRKDPRVSATQADFDAQFALRMRIRDKLTEVHDAINGIRALRTQIEGWEKRAEGSTGARVRRGASSLKTKLSAVEEELIQVKAKSRQDTLNYPAKLNLKIGGLAVRDITKVRVGWPLLAVLVASVSIFDAAYEGAGPLMLLLVPAGIVGFVLGRITTTPEGVVAAMQDQAGRGIAIAIGLALA